MQLDDIISREDMALKIISLVAQARREYRLQQGCSGAVACASIGLQLVRESLPDGTDGLLQGKRVVVNQSINWVPRAEYTTFHEIIHHLLDEDGELIEYFTERLRKYPDLYKKAIERCCEIGAAEFLLPRAVVQATIEREGLSVDLVEQMATQHGSSLVATAIQLAVCAPIACYLVICCYGTVPRLWPPQEQFYLEYASASSQVKYPLARYTVVPPDHLLAAAWQARSVLAGSTYIPYRSGWQQPCYGEVRWVGGRVVGLLLLERPISANQLSLFD